MNLSIIAKSKLPIDFINELKQDFTDRNVDKILAGMSEERFTTFRVNNLKGSVAEVENELTKNGIEFEKINLCVAEKKQDYKKSDFSDISNNANLNISDDNIIFVAYVLLNKNEKDLSKLKVYEDGKIYVQSISSMIPPLVLAPKQGENVLDLASAPGSKTTQMASMMRNNGYILANEIDKFRCEKLKYNVEKQGSSIVHIINEDGTDTNSIINCYKRDNANITNMQLFDKVLVDAPCSGEGRFIIQDKKTYQYWSLKMQSELVETQKKLLASALELCKENGTIVYSTCALSKAENECVIDWAIKNFSISIEKIDIQIKAVSKQDEANKNGLIIKGNKKGFSEKTENTVKILPNKLLEGFFIAKIKNATVK